MLDEDSTLFDALKIENAKAFYSNHSEDSEQKDLHDKQNTTHYELNLIKNSKF